MVYDATKFKEPATGAITPLAMPQALVVHSPEDEDREAQYEQENHLFLEATCRKFEVDTLAMHLAAKAIEVVPLNQIEEAVAKQKQQIQQAEDEKNHLKYLLSIKEINRLEKAIIVWRIVREALRARNITENVSLLDATSISKTKGKIDGSLWYTPQQNVSTRNLSGHEAYELYIECLQRAARLPDEQQQSAINPGLALSPPRPEYPELTELFVAGARCLAYAVGIPKGTQQDPVGYGVYLDRLLPVDRDLSDPNTYRATFDLWPKFSEIVFAEEYLADSALAFIADRGPSYARYRLQYLYGLTQQEVALITALAASRAISRTGLDNASARSIMILQTESFVDAAKGQGDLEAEIKGLKLLAQLRGLIADKQQAGSPLNVFINTLTNIVEAENADKSNALNAHEQPLELIEGTTVNNDTEEED